MEPLRTGAPSGEIKGPLPAGRELDVAVAEKVMRLKVVFDEDKYGEMHIWWVVPTVPGTVADWDKDYLAHYSTDIAAAWLVVEKMIQRETYFTIGMLAVDNRWWVDYDGPAYRREHRIYAETAPLAICRAALKAMGAA